MKTILCLTEVTPNSENALKYAREIALRSHAQLILLQSIIAYSGKDSTQMLCQLSASGSQASSGGESQIPGEPEASPAVMEGSRPDQDDTSGHQAFTIGEMKVDLLVLSMETWHNLSCLDQFSPIAQLIQQAQCPVLVIPGGSDFKLFKQIVLMAGLEEEEKIDIDFVSNFSRLFDTKVTYFQVDSQPYACESSFRFLGNFRQKVRHNDVACYTNDCADTKEGIQRFIQNIKTDLVVLVHRPESEWQQCLEEMTLGKIDWKKNVPLLALNQQKSTFSKPLVEANNELGLTPAVHE